MMLKLVVRADWFFRRNIVSPPLSQPPSANAGPDQAVIEGNPVTLDGRGSIDPEGDIVSYQWTQTSGPSVTLNSTTLAEGLSSELAATFFKCSAEHKPVFGFACDYQKPVPDANGSYVISHRGARSEYDHRNRYYITLGKNNIEDWIGRKLEKYIPGVYWYTLLSDGLLTQHGVKLADLAAEAMTAETLGDGSLHLLKFFESPEEWKENARRLDDLCERIEGVFSRRLVEAAVAGITNYLEYDETIAHWR
jgi:PKD domain